MADFYGIFHNNEIFIYGHFLAKIIVKSPWEHYYDQVLYQVCMLNRKGRLYPKS